MSVVSVFSGSFCREDEFVEKLVHETVYERLTDEMIVRRAADLSALSPQMLKRSFSGKPSVFNPFTRERERSFAWLKLAVAEHLQETGLLLHGFSAHLVPRSIRHVLRICLIADMTCRIEAASRLLAVGETEAADRINMQDRRQASWVRELHGNPDPWDPGLYDMVLPTNKTDLREAVTLVKRGLTTEALQPSDISRKAARDFLTAARIEARLAGEGHVVKVTVTGRKVVLTIDRPVLMLERLEEELKTVVRTVGTFAQIEVCTKPATKESDTYRKYDSQVPSKVLLVDDEREFVQTLSERLVMRDIGSATAFDGDSALALLQEDEPEVMLLDLRMPGIDGMEVLKRVKAEHPEIEVIVLTGHGTDEDRKRCLESGAFAYLEKPVDIDVLSDTIRRANDKMRAHAKGKKG